MNSGQSNLYLNIYESVKLRMQRKISTRQDVFRGKSSQLLPKYGIEARYVRCIYILLQTNRENAEKCEKQTVASVHREKQL